MHHPSQAMADRVSVRTYLLAGVSVLSAGMIAASPAGPPQADHTVALTPLAANSAIVPAAAPAAPDPDPLGEFGSHQPRRRGAHRGAADHRRGAHRGGADHRR